jgi:hypothetical protein
LQCRRIKVDLSEKIEVDRAAVAEMQSQPGAAAQIEAVKHRSGGEIACRPCPAFRQDLRVPHGLVIGHGSTSQQVDCTWWQKRWWTG